jgi:hypothetical protein
VSHCELPCVLGEFAVPKRIDKALRVLEKSHKADQQANDCGIAISASRAAMHGIGLFIEDFHRDVSDHREFLATEGSKGIVQNALCQP